MKFKVGKATGIEIRWSKSGEWTLTDPDGIQYSFWFWFGRMRWTTYPEVVVFGMVIGPLLIYIGRNREVNK